jgi:spermidine/putrescine-binding protein
MNKFLSAIAKPFVWIGKATHLVSEWFPKITGIVAYSETEAKVLAPAFIKIFDDVETLAKLASKDGALMLLSIETIVADIAALGGAGALNPAEYAKVISAVSNFVTAIHNNPDWKVMFDTIKEIVVDYEALGSEVKSALARSEQILGVGQGAAASGVVVPGTPFTITGPGPNGPVTVTNTTA